MVKSLTMKSKTTAKILQPTTKITKSTTMRKATMQSSILVTTTTTTANVKAKTTTTTARKTTTSIRSFLAIVFVISSLVREINGFQPIQLNGAGRAMPASGTDARKLFGGYRITPKSCRATKTLPISDPRSKGPTICMFNHECAQRNGEVVGACMDGFLFGACCQIPNKQDIESTLINDAQNAYFQQYQQNKLQLQQSMSNAAAAQSYENYGESAQQQSVEVSNSNSNTNNYVSQQNKPSQTQTSNYQSTTPQVASSSTIYRPSSSSSNIYKRPQTIPSTTTSSQEKYDANTSSQSGQESDSSSTENVASSTTKVAIPRPTTLAPISQPPRVHVHKDSVKISSPSSPPHNDDFVMQVLSTLPPDHENDHVTFTTEVPMKIAGNSGDQLSSESNSFEEESATRIPVKLIEKPSQQATQSKPQQHQHQNQKTTTHKTQETNQKPQQSSNMHHHNHLLLDVNEFTHSDITHPGADADIVDEDLQFSTGYGPQPVFADAPDKSGNYGSTSTSKTPQPEDKYVLVQTISNDQPYKQPITSGDPTTSSSITTHVDSIESIILQLNNSNHGPMYSVISQTDQSRPSTIQSNYDNNEKVPSYTSPATIPVKPLAAAYTESPSTQYQEIETKRPEDYQQQKYPAMNAQVPAYLEPVTTNLNYIPTNEYAADFMAETSSLGPSSYKPEVYSPTTTSGDDSASAYNDHTVPDKNYNDGSASEHQTSEFNKMPAVGIAYPIDMSYVDEDSNIVSPDASGYQKLSTQNTSQKPVQTSSTTSGYTANPEQTATTYMQMPSNSDSSPSKRPIASYIGVVTAPTYNKQPSSSYNHVPPEVSITSHTTKVQEEYNNSPSYQTSQAQKQPTNSYADTTASTAKPSKTQASTYSYTASLPTAAPRPPYDSLILGSSTTKPKPSKRPGSHNTKKTSKPSGSKKPSNTYSQAPQNDYQQTNYKKPVTPVPESPSNSYNPQPASYGQQSGEAYLTNTYPVPTENQPSNSYDTVKQPTNTYDTGNQPSNSYDTVKQPANAYDSVNQPSNGYDAIKQPSNQYGGQDYSGEKLSLPTYNQPSVSYSQEQYISSPPAQSQQTRKPVTNKKPISTSYVTGPTSPRPPTTSAYDNEVPPLIIADDKLDSFIHPDIAVASPSPISNTYQSPAYASAVTPLQVHQPQNNYNNHKKPGFVKVKPTTRPPHPTVIITPKPSTNSYGSPSDNDVYNPSTTSLPAFASTSYIFSSSITRRPGSNTPEYVSLPAITSNDFDDPGYYGGQGSDAGQSVTQATYAVPSDDRPAFPGYYGPTPTYPAFQIPGEKNDGSVEETYTSPNDFVNFPPVRNPNLNMSAASSAVTSDLELSTPAFVEDGILKDKMNTLVHKIVESLQGNFEALADMIDETATPSTYQSSGAGGAGYTTLNTRKTTRKPVTSKPKATTKKPVNRATTKPPSKKPAATTRKPVTKRTTTRKPATTRKPTRKPTPTSTNPAPFQDEIVDEEDEEDVSPSENEIGDSDTLGIGGGGRNIQCGVRPHVKSARIVGGKGSAFGAYPWQVLVRESTWLGLFTKNKCGGVLITSKYVITAAHCQPGFLASLVAVLGEFDISGDLESKKAVTKNVKRVIVHRQYDPATFENDLALLELESPVQFDTHIVPICMPTDHADFTGRMATVTGWGRLKYGGGVPSVLQEVQVPVIENNVCQEMFITAGHNKKILNSFLCAGYANGQKDSCEGDSGGPLVLQRPDGRYELAGTVSHGIKCAAPYLPGVYMRTTYYKPWLRAITGVK